jgi:putative PIN family toxin of toxin-antitoxin system
VFDASSMPVPLIACCFGGDWLDKERSRICRKALHYIRRHAPPQVPGFFMSTIAPRPPPPEIVIDTNTVLDWLLFEDPAGLVVGAAVVTGQLTWVATSAMVDELHSVLSRPGFERWQARIEPTRMMTSQHCQIVTAQARGAAEQLHCTDADDQKFIDLALDRRAPWLLTRDKALLRLAKRAALQGVRVLTPAHWMTSIAPTAAP